MTVSLLATVSEAVPMVSCRVSWTSRFMLPSTVVDVVSSSLVVVSKLSSTVTLWEPSVEASRLKESSVRVESSSTACWALWSPMATSTGPSVSRRSSSTSSVSWLPWPVATWASPSASTSTRSPEPALMFSPSRLVALPRPESAPTSLSFTCMLSSPTIASSRSTSSPAMTPRLTPVLITESSTSPSTATPPFTAVVVWFSTFWSKSTSPAAWICVITRLSVTTSPSRR